MTTITNNYANVQLMMHLMNRQKNMYSQYRQIRSSTVFNSLKGGVSTADEIEPLSLAHADQEDFEPLPLSSISSCLPQQCPSVLGLGDRLGQIEETVDDILSSRPNAQSSLSEALDSLPDPEVATSDLISEINLEPFDNAVGGILQQDAFQVFYPPSKTEETLLPQAIHSVKPLQGKRKVISSKEERPAPTKRQRLEEYKLRKGHSDAWMEKFEELVEYKRDHGHCCVPRTYSENMSLGRWVKRQRHQYKLKNDGKISTLKNERVTMLEQIGFVWDPHCALWEDRFNELKEYMQKNGHCNVPSNYQENQSLAAWVKCQRRQQKLNVSGEPSNMTEERISALENLGFRWNIPSRRVSTPGSS